MQFDSNSVVLPGDIVWLADVATVAPRAHASHLLDAMAGVGSEGAFAVCTCLAFCSFWLPSKN